MVSQFQRIYPVVGGAVPALIGLAVLAGWWLEVPGLTRVVPGWPTMKPLTALLCLVSGAALLLLAPQQRPSFRGPGRALAALGGALALVALSENLFGIDLRLDLLLAGRSVGRPVLRTALAFTLLAVAELSLDRAPRGSIGLAQVLALLAGSVAAIAFLGFTFGIPELFSSGWQDRSNGMAVHTAFAVVLLASGLLAARPGVGFVAALTSDLAGGLVARRLLLGLLGFVPVALLVVTGRQLGWYGAPIVPALLVFLAVGEGVVLIVITAVRMNDHDTRMRQLVSLAPDGIFVADLQGRYTEVNAAGCRLLGLRREEILGKRIVDLIPSDQVPLLWETRESILRGGVDVREWSLRHRDGHYVPVEVSAAILPDGRWQGFVRDISDRKRVEASEARQRRWLRNIVDQMPEGVLIVDAAGRPVLENRAVLAFASERTDLRDPWGNPTRFDVRLPDGEPVPPDDRPSVRALARGESTLARELAARKDGKLIPILVSAAPIRDDGGTITGATILAQDITPIKELERLRDEWASIVAHDLRQPVNVISLSAETLERSCEPSTPDRVRKTIGRIREGTTRLNRMISDLSDASRIEANRMTVLPAAVDLSELMHGVCESLRDATGGRELTVDAPPGLGAWIDPDRIQQVLTNLIVNAAKYGAPGTEIRVSAAARDDVVEVAVTNRGRGIPAEQIPGLFSRFGRTPEARLSKTPGTGLGLYIARGLVEAHDGRIWVDSTPGQTTFRFVVPRAPLAAAISTEPAPAPG